MTLPSIGLGPTTSEFTRQEDLPPWPAPEITNRVVHGDEYAHKGAVRDMVRYAEARGWTATVTYAKGCWPTTGQKPSRQRESYAVHMERGGEMAVTVYVEGPSPSSPWSWETLYHWIKGKFPSKYEKVTPLRDTLT